jgi:hypothetical protein
MQIEIHESMINLLVCISNQLQALPELLIQGPD